MSTPTDQALTEEGNQAWLAYQAMSASKKTYFDFLQTLDQKYTNNGTASIAENLKLEELLKTHDTKVAAFNKAMTRVSAPAAREALMIKLSAANVAIGSH